MGRGLGHDSLEIRIPALHKPARGSPARLPVQIHHGEGLAAEPLIGFVTAPFRVHDQIELETSFAREVFVSAIALQPVDRLRLL
jgi:hypothetical protein